MGHRRGRHARIQWTSNVVIVIVLDLFPAFFFPRYGGFGTRKNEIVPKGALPGSDFLGHFRAGRVIGHLGIAVGKLRLIASRVFGGELRLIAIIRVLSV